MALNPALALRERSDDHSSTRATRRVTGVRAALSFAGPAFLVAVGYMDPGNWGTDLAAGSRFGYRLVWVLVGANLVALVLQYLSAKLGIATGKDLAALVGGRLRTGPRLAYWAVVEAAMLATEIAEFIGVVVALRLLTGMGLLPAVALGAALVLGLLASPTLRRLELVVFVLLGVIGGAYVLQVVLAQPALDQVLGGMVPRVNIQSLPVATGILGAVVMPHNLFLHSGLIRHRCGDAAPRRVLRRATIETAVALNLALLVNGAILATSAAAFGERGMEVVSLGQAHEGLAPILGTLAAGGFAVALLAAGLASSTTGSLAGQYVLDGLLGLKVSVLTRRAITLVPAVSLLAFGVNEVSALVWSQVVLSLALPTVALPLVTLTGRRDLMGELVNSRALRATATVAITALVAINSALLLTAF